MSRCRLLIPHEVQGQLREVFAGFTRELFEHLAPKFPPSKLLRYDGNAVGDLVKIRLGVGPVGATWISEITEHELSEGEAFFVDEGRQLPPPLNYWRHKHLLTQVSPATVRITEDITFGTPLGLLTSLMKPVIRAQFEARGPRYRSYFGGAVQDSRAA